MSASSVAAIFVAATFLAIGKAGSDTVEIELQRSADMADWETVPIIPDFLTEEGKLRQPAGEITEFFRLRIKGIEGELLPPAPSGMALIPAGSFEMGDSFNDSSDFGGERPVHTVHVSAFFMDRTPVTKALWDEVRAWAMNNGYTDLPAAGGKAVDHPVHSITWYDVVKWLNARSEMEGRIPSYYTSAAQTTPYRTGQVNVQNDWVKWNAGYRLPTEAEWEKAARGGLEGQRFPWGNTITHSQANYSSSSSYSYDISPTRGSHPTYNTGGIPYTSPVGSFTPNGYGLYDMAGNVFEWCWDWWASGYYAVSPASDPRGPNSGSFRVFRGGGWDGSAIGCRAAYRSSIPTSGLSSFGFRCVLPPGQP